MSDRVSSEVRSKIMRAVRSKRTRLEDKLGAALWGEGVRYRRNVKSLFGIPDFAIKKYKLVIFVDSCFWHGCPLHCKMSKTNVEFWEKKIERNRQRDIKVTDHYITRGWRVIRIWEHDLRENFECIIETIINFIHDITPRR